jgi:hypothetical protein
MSGKGTRNRTNSEAQSAAFVDSARELGCDDDPAHFDEMLKKVAKHKAHDEAVRPGPRSADSKEQK